MSEHENLPLTYGSTIYLSPQGDPDYYIYSDGFVKSTLSLRAHNQGQARNIFNHCLFKIYPSFSNTIKKEALTKINERFTNDSYSDAMKSEVAEDLKDRLASEFKYNLESYEKVQGTPIAFDQPVQFLHVASNKFLCLQNKEAEIERENYMIDLVQYPSNMTVFKFCASFKHQKSSEGTIYPGDFVFITSPQMIQKKTPYLHATRSAEEEIQSNIRNILEDEYNESPDFQKSVRVIPFNARFPDGFPGMEAWRINDNKAKTAEDIFIPQKKEVNASLEYAMRWQIHVFADSTQQENYLTYGDVIWINNPEANCTLITRKDVNDLPVVEFTKEKQEEHSQHYVGHTNGMWIVEHKNPHMGGNVRWDHSFRLKSLTLGLYLAVKKDSTSRLFAGAEQHDSHNNLWRFAPVPNARAGKDSFKSNGFIPRETFLLLESEKPDLPAFIGTRNEIATLLNETHYLHFENFKPILEKYSEEHDICRIDCANVNEVWETNFLNSCFPKLKKYVEFVYKHRKVSDLPYISCAKNEK